MNSYQDLLEAFESLNLRKRRDPDALSESEMADWRRMRRELEQALFQSAPDPAVDTREYLRVPVALQVRYWSSNELKDRYIPVLGEGGLRVSTVDPLPLGTLLDLEILIASRGVSVPVSGEVVWVSAEEDPAERCMGIRFVNLSYEQKRAVYELVDDSMKERLLERRRHARVDARLQVEFLYADGYFELATEDVSQGGVFIATSDLLPVGERLRMVLHLPGAAPAIKAVAEVRRLVEEARPGQPVGMGAGFVNLTESDRQTLLDFIHSRLSRGDSESGGDERRRYPRMQRRVKLRFQSEEIFGVSASKDLSVGGVFIQTHEPPALGKTIAVTLIHPVSLQSLELQGRVVRVVNADPGQPAQVPGVGVAFDKLSRGERQALDDYLRYYATVDGAPTAAEEE